MHRLGMSRSAPYRVAADGIRRTPRGEGEAVKARRSSGRFPQELSLLQDQHAALGGEPPSSRPGAQGRRRLPASGNLMGAAGWGEKALCLRSGGTGGGGPSSAPGVTCQDDHSPSALTKSRHRGPERGASGSLLRAQASGRRQISAKSGSFLRGGGRQAGAG